MTTLPSRRVELNVGQPPARGDTVRIRLQAGCKGGGKPHVDAEDGAEGKVTDDAAGGDHPYFVLFRAGRSVGFLGRLYAAEELELR